MELSSKFYIVALIAVTLVTILSVIGIKYLGRGDPESRLNRNSSKIMIAVIAVGALSAGFLAFKVWDSREIKMVDTETVVEQFNYEAYIAENEHHFTVDILYGEEFVPEYDSSKLTLVTDEFDYNGMVGENRVSLVFEDKQENVHTLEYVVNVIDNDYPELVGVVDIHLDYGRLFTEDLINIKAYDPIDGELPVNLDGTVNTSVPGIYKLKAYAEDKNLNRTEEEFYVIVGGRDILVNSNSGGNENPSGGTSEPIDSEELTEVAKMVIAGDYGSGVKMQYALAKDGYNYLEVSKEVERLKNSGYKPSESDEDETSSIGVKITAVHKAEEKVEITNESNSEIDISLWTLVSEKGNKKYLFPYGAKLGPNQILTVTSGANASGNYVMSNETVWNIKQENTVTLVDRTNKEISKQKIRGDAEESPDEDEEEKEEEITEGKLSVEEVAKQVIKGQYGNGAARRANLKAAGYDYETVQAQVNKILIGN